MLDNINICIPTYKRKWPVILSTIRSNPDLMFTLCVRKEDYDAGYYDEVQFKLDNIRYMLLENVNCIGETRDFILQKSIEEGYDYCFMIDDTQYGIHDASNRIKYLKTILKNCLNRFETDKYADKAFGFVFSRKSFAITTGKTETYFLSQLCQTYILNCKICKKYDLHFRPMKEVGIEDLAFYIEAADKGLVALSDSRFLRIGEMPSIKREGGCHVNMEGKTERDTQTIRAEKLCQYIHSNRNIKDKNFLKLVDSVLYQGTWYFKFNTKYARSLLK